MSTAEFRRAITRPVNRASAIRRLTPATKLGRRDIGRIVVEHKLLPGRYVPTSQHDDLTFHAYVGIATVIEPLGVVDRRVAVGSHVESLTHLKGMRFEVGENFRDPIDLSSRVNNATPH